ncbi:MAG: 16S rRNA (cytidine(1402)-2'-O)-methyltransferase [Salibacteraceae bacterium]
MANLYLVPTPIGNLSDITLRALETLRSVDLILAEDTRQTAKLLQHYEIKKPVIAHHQHNEHRQVEQLVNRLQAGESMALVSDAGTPGISDPGFLLVRACLAAEIEVECLPGATALVPALVASGLPADRFVFEGFLPLKKGRQTRLEQLAEENRTIVLYESPHRLVKTLGQLVDKFGPDRKAAVSRELTKVYAETRRGSLQELLTHFSAGKVKGELVIVVEGLSKKTPKAP